MRLKRWKTRDVITHDRLNAIHDAIPEILGGKFIRVVRRGNKHTVSYTGPDRLGGERSQRFFFSQITASLPLPGASNRWSYDFQQVRWDGSFWALVDPPFSGSALNMAEVPNGPIGVQGNGVNVDTLPSGFTIRPITVGVVVPTYPQTVDTDTYYWFSMPNGVDGTCPTSESGT